MGFVADARRPARYLNREAVVLHRSKTSSKFTCEASCRAERRPARYLKRDAAAGASSSAERQSARPQRDLLLFYAGWNYDERMRLVKALQSDPDPEIDPTHWGVGGRTNRYEGPYAKNR